MTLYENILGEMSLSHSPNPLEYTVPRERPKINYVQCVITMCHCRFTSCNQCTTLVMDTVNGRGCARWWREGVYGKSLFLSIFGEPKILLEIKSV